MENDKELKTISVILSALNELDPLSRERVFKYVIERLDIKIILNEAPEIDLANNFQPKNSPLESTYLESSAQTSNNPIDIRSFKEEKAPQSAIEMAAVVAYYVQKLAPSEERKTYIDVGDIEKYFDQAKYPIPKIPKSALLNAKAAGYLEPVDRGKYRLNPVGHNLVSLSLPYKGGLSTKKKSRLSSRKQTKVRK